MRSDQNKKVDIVSLGEPMVEFCATQSASLKDASLFERGWGGDTSNMLVSAARLGKKTGYITRLGDDEFGKCFLEMWHKEGVDTSNVVVEKGAFTGIYFIALLAGGKHEFTYYRRNSAASDLSPDDVRQSYVERAKVFHFSGISQAISESCREAAFKGAQIARKAKRLVSYDPNIRLKLWPISTARSVVNYTLGIVDICLPSLEDAKIMTGRASPDEAAEAILKRGPEVVALKLGSKGCLVRSRNEKFKVPGFEVDVVDTTGAGDAFDGAFLAGLVEGRELKEASRFANAAAALKTLGRGAVTPLPSRRQVDEFLAT